MAVDFDEAKVERNIAGMWLGWTLATAAGLILGYMPAAMFVDLIDLGIARVLVPLLAGTLIGLAQWFVLRRYVTHSGDWVINLAAGWIVGYSLGLLIVDWLANSLLGMMISYLLFGIIVALFQWPVLRREVPNLLPWALANMVGWALGAFLSQVVIAALFGRDPAALPWMILVNSAITGLVAGAITGLALVQIVRQPERRQPPVEVR